MTTCEYCGRALRQGDSIHAIKYGSLTSNGFKAAQDSAVVVICEPCGSLVSKIVYSYLDRDKLKYPVIFKMYLDLKASMEKRIQTDPGHSKATKGKSAGPPTRHRYLQVSTIAPHYHPPSKPFQTKPISTQLRKVMPLPASAGKVQLGA